jgi:predicted CopG family antitoxin
VELGVRIVNGTTDVETLGHTLNRPNRAFNHGESPAKVLIRNYSAIITMNADATTIQIEIDVKQELDRLKQTYHSKTYNEVIKSLIRSKGKSLAGHLSTKNRITLEEALKGLRDRHDRY